MYSGFRYGCMQLLFFLLLPQSLVFYLQVGFVIDERLRVKKNKHKVRKAALCVTFYCFESMVMFSHLVAS